MSMQVRLSLFQNDRAIPLYHEPLGRQAVQVTSCQSKVEFYSFRGESDHHDDGLVHGHLWAMSSTVR